LTLKREDLSETGSFKARGAAVRLSRLATADGAQRNVVAASTGNFGLGLAVVGARLGNVVHVVVPTSTPKAKRLRLVEAGAAIMERGDDLDEATDYAKLQADERGWTFVGQADAGTLLGLASLGLELWEQAPHVDTVFLPLGVGAAAASVALARNALNVPALLVVVVPERCAAWANSWQVGRPITCEPSATLADSLRTGRPAGPLYRFLRRNAVSLITVSEAQIESAQEALRGATGADIEGASAVGLAGVFSPRGAELAGGRNVGLVVCGRTPGQGGIRAGRRR
jgi:threonine dehydratase